MTLTERSRGRLPRKLGWSIALAVALLAHYYFFYVRQVHTLSDRDKDLVREAVSVCVDMPLIDWIPHRYTPVADEQGRVKAIDAAFFYGVTSYRINLRTIGGVLEGCSIDFFPWD